MISCLLIIANEKLQNHNLTKVWYPDAQIHHPWNSRLPEKQPTPIEMMAEGEGNLEVVVEEWNESKTQPQDQLTNCNLFHEVSYYVTCLFVDWLCLATILKSSFYKGKLYVGHKWTWDHSRCCQCPTHIPPSGWVISMRQLTSNCQYLCLFSERLSQKPCQVTLPACSTALKSKKLISPRSCSPLMIHHPWLQGNNTKAYVLHCFPEVPYRIKL